MESCPGGSFGWMSSLVPKGLRVIPHQDTCEVRVPFPVRVLMGGKWLISLSLLFLLSLPPTFSLPLSLPSSLSKINKYILRWRLSKKRVEHNYNECWKRFRSKVCIKWIRSGDWWGSFTKPRVGWVGGFWGRKQASKEDSICKVLWSEGILFHLGCFIHYQLGTNTYFHLVTSVLFCCLFWDITYKDCISLK